MNAFVALPNAFHWTPQQLAEAVPLRLHEALAFDALDGDNAVRRPIQAGASSLDAVEIVSGLKAGDRVVVSGTDQFDNADRVRISGN